MKRRNVFLPLAALTALMAVPSTAFAQLSITVSFGPPALPVYDQPVDTEANAMWQPGYWAYDPNDGYYWVPGTWVQPPQPGVYWTPGYWGWDNGSYFWNQGYWAPQVGYYGGVNYGYGYYGNGYVGGNWDHDQFRYNTAVNNIDTRYVRNYYVNRTVIVNRPMSRIAYDGGPGGLNVRPTREQIALYGRQQRYPQTVVQAQHAAYAAQSRLAFAKLNHGAPLEAAVPRPLAEPYRGQVHGAVASQSHAPAMILPLAHDQAAYQTPSRPMPHTGPVRPVSSFHAPATATQHVQPMKPAPNAYHAPAAAPQRAQPVQHAQPAYHAPAAAPQRAQPVNPAQHAQPAYHAPAAAPQRAQPVQHAQPAYHAPAAAPQHVQPAYHAPVAAPQRVQPAQPVYHAPAAPPQHTQPAAPAAPAYHAPAPPMQRAAPPAAPVQHAPPPAAAPHAPAAPPARGEPNAPNHGPERPQ